MLQSSGGTSVYEEIFNSFFLTPFKNFYILQNILCEVVDAVKFCFFLGFLFVSYFFFSSAVLQFYWLT